jgi:hypothetical protein
MPLEPTGGVKGSKPRLKIAKEEIPQLSREYLIHRNEQMRNKNLTAQMELTLRRGQLISKDLPGGETGQLLNDRFASKATKPVIPHSQTRRTGCQGHEKGLAGNRCQPAQ